MTAIYLESSAILKWLLGEPDAERVLSKINRTEAVVTSVLTLVEVERALIRAETWKMLTSGQAERLRGLFARAKASWILMEISAEVRARAMRGFPAEPVRTLDAIHLSTALIFLRVFPDLEMLSFDQRIRDNGSILGIA
jgi:predicted nucleic acid-binding protein